MKLYSHTKKQLISLLLLVMVLFPMYEKLHHELSHLNDTHCATTTVHFCETEHDCDLCDFIFSSCSEPPKKAVILCFYIANNTDNFTLYESTKRITPNYFFSLKAPPVC